LKTSHKMRILATLGAMVLGTDNVLGASLHQETHSIMNGQAKTHTSLLLAHPYSSQNLDLSKHHAHNSSPYQTLAQSEDAQDEPSVAPPAAGPATGSANAPATAAGNATAMDALDERIKKVTGPPAQDAGVKAVDNAIKQVDGHLAKANVQTLAQA